MTAGGGGCSRRPNCKLGVSGFAFLMRLNVWFVKYEHPILLDVWAAVVATCAGVIRAGRWELPSSSRVIGLSSPKFTCWSTIPPAWSITTSPRRSSLSTKPFPASWLECCIPLITSPSEQTAPGG